MKQKVKNKNFFTSWKNNTEIITRVIMDSDLTIDETIFDLYRLVDLDPMRLASLDKYKLRETTGGIG